MTDKASDKKDEKLVAVFNKGQRSYDTSVGKLHPKQSVEVPESEAKQLMDYFDIVDLKAVAPKASQQLNDLKAENKALKEELAAAKKELAESDKDAGKGGSKGHK